MNRIFPNFTDFLIFFAVPLSIEVMAPEWAIVRVSLVIAFAVYTLEGVGHSSPCLVSRQGGLVLGLALQHQPK